MKNCTTCDCPDCDCKRAKRGSHAVFGTTVMGNGIPFRWLAFIDSKLPLEAAKAEAVRLWKGAVRYVESVESCRERLAGRPRSLSLSVLPA